MKLPPLFRAISADIVRSNPAEGQPPSDTIEFSFSSEEPVDRWYGTEILSHKDGAFELGRLNDGANLLWNHDPNAVIGVVEKAWKAPDGRLHAVTRWGTSALAAEKRKDVEAGIIRNVSFGYQIKEMDEQPPAKRGEPATYLATKWMPFEVSFVSIPADQTVGVGRAGGGEPIEITITNQGGRVMDKVEQKPEIDVTKLQADAAAQERARIAGIRALGKQFKQDELADAFIGNGKGLEDFRAAVLEKLGQKQIPITGNEAVVGMTEKEIREFSFLRAMRAQLFPNERKYQEEAKFEREVSDAAVAKAGKAARGFMIPVDVLRAKRDLSVGTSTAGGNLVATDLLSGSFIELLRNMSVLQRAGATVLNGLVGNIAIPKQSGAATAYWVAESGSPTEAQQSVSQVAMSPKTVGAFTDYSRKLLLQSSIDVENFVRNDLAQVIALAIDLAGLYGTGASNQPTGLKAILDAYNTASQVKNFAAGVPTFAEVVDLETKVASLNAAAGAMKYISNASMVGSLKTKEKATGYPVYVLEGGQMNGYPVLMSNQSASGDLWFGNFADLLMGFWSGLDLLVDPYTGGTAGTVRIVALQDCDIAVRHEQSFARGNDVP